MANRYDTSQTRRSSRTSSSFQQTELSPEAAQQVENFVDVLAGLLGNQAEASAVVKEAPTQPQQRQRRTPWQPAEKTDTSSGHSVDHLGNHPDAASKAEPTVSRVFSPEVTPYTLTPPSGSNGSESQRPHTAGDTKTEDAKASVSSSPIDTNNESAHSFSPVEVSSDSPVETFEPSQEIDPASATIDAIQVAAPGKGVASAGAESSALVLASAQPPQSASDSNVDAESAGEALNHLRTLLVGLEEQLYDPDKLLKLLLPAVTEAIRDRLKARRSAIANVFRADMAVPIQEQIAIERDSIIDALYPVIGSTVAEYFTDTLRTMNSRVATTAVDAEAASGIHDYGSSLPPGSNSTSGSLVVVRALFLMHKPTGLLLAKVLSPREINLSSEKQSEMLAAVRGFANTQIDQAAFGSSAKAGQYRHGQILVEFAESCYLAALVEGDPSVAFLRSMRQVLDETVADYSDIIHAFEGNADTVPDAIAHRLKRLLNAHSGAGKRRRPAVMAGVGVCLVGGIAAALWGWQQFQQHQRTLLTERVERTAALLNQGSGVDITARTSEDQVILEGTVLEFNDAHVIRQSFEQIPGVGAVVDRVEAKPLTIPTRVYFYTNSIAISPRDIAGKIADVNNLLTQHPEYHLKLIGYVNPVDEAETPDLGLKRALAVADVLADQGIARQRLDAVMSDGIPSGVNIEYQPWLSQAVLFEIMQPAQAEPTQEE